MRTRTRKRKKKMTLTFQLIKGSLRSQRRSQLKRRKRW